MARFKWNEYVVYNRYQCYPLYKVTYSRMEANFRGANDSSNGVTSPPFGWVPQNEFYKIADRPTWALHARTVFDDMMNSPSDGTYSTHVAENWKALRKLDLQSKLALYGRTFLADISNSASEAKLFRQALDNIYSGELKRALKFVKELSHHTAIDADISKKLEMLPSSSTVERRENPLPATLDPNTELCLICCNSYSEMSSNWKMLAQCEHKLCADCYKKIEITRETMAGVSHTSIKCPFCQLTSGVPIGTCPTGEMSVGLVSSHCAGYENCSTIMITYTAQMPTDSSSPYSDVVRRRRAFLPNNPEGKSILNLLRIAWDRRIIFTVGTSYTTGQENTLVWNIHHKTKLTGGVLCHGYPDDTYLQRVRAELRNFGVE